MAPRIRKPGDPPANKRSREFLDKFIANVESGETQAQALRNIGKNVGWLVYWQNDEWFKPIYQRAKERQRIAIASGRTDDKYGFIEFRQIVLGRHTFPHMQQWGEWFESDENDHIMILCPPETAKTTFVLDYILWRIYLDPNIQIGYVSKSLPHSIKQVSKLKNIITENHTYNTLCGGNLVPGPGDPHPWTASYFTVAAREWQAGMDEADYTVAAFGAGSQITGSRFDLLVFDDPDDVNVGRADREKIWNVILQAGETRLGTSGRMIVIGNRQDEEDVYRLILDQWTEDPDLWAVYTQPAVMEWETLSDGRQYPKTVIWPEKFGLPKSALRKPVEVDGPWEYHNALDFFSRKSRRLGHRFFLVYQNDPLADRTKDFTREMVDGALNLNVEAGKVPSGSIVICSLDPAPTGGSALLVYALLPPGHDGIRRRLVVDFEWGVNWRHGGMIERIKSYGEKYHPRWWVIERSATTKLFLEDQVVLDIIRRQGAWLYDLTTGSNKEALDFGVSSLRELFIGESKIIMPAATLKDKELTKPLRDQLVDYHPDTNAPHDGPMTLWFAERLIRDKHLLKMDYGRTGQKTKFWGDPYNTKFTQGSWSFKKPQAVVSSQENNPPNSGL